MRIYLTRTNIVIGVGGIFLIGLGFFARNDLMRLIRPSLSKSELPLFESLDKEKSIISDIASQEKNPSRKSEDEDKEPFPALPPYLGRGVDEVRPDLEVLKNLNEEQKNALYRDIKIFSAEIKENPITGDWVFLGTLKKNIGDYEGARDAWAYASLLFPGEETPLFNLGELYRHYLPDFRQSEQYYRSAIEKGLIGAPRAYVALSDLYFFSYKEKSNFADDVLEEGVAAYPDNTYLMGALASLYERIGKREQAILWWERVLAKEPDNQFVQKALEDLRKRKP